MKTIKLEDLLGEHWLDAVDYNTVQRESWTGRLTDANSITFRLDGVCYTAIEDPDDGYRSTMEELIVDDDVTMKNVFNPTWVLCRPSEPKREYYSSEHSNDDGIELIEFVDVWNGEVILVVGTDHSDQWYPVFVSNWIPENMAVNRG